MVYKIYNTSSPIRDLRFVIAGRIFTLYKSADSSVNSVDLEANTTALVVDKNYTTNFTRNEIQDSRHLRQLVSQGNITVDVGTISTPPEEAVHVTP